MKPTSSSRVCAHHEGAPAVAICTECRADICALCHGSDLRGYCICAACREKYAPATTPWEDPRVDYSPSALGRTLVDVLASPRTFFGKVRFSGSVVPAIAFGLICILVGLAFSTTYSVLFVPQFAKQLTDTAAQYDLSVETLKTAVFVAIPLRVALVFLLHTGAFHLWVKVAGGRSTFKLSARIVAYASAAYVFLLIPPIASVSLGHFLAIIWLFNIEVGALHTYFRLGLWKTLFVAMATLFTIMWFAF